MSTSRTVSKGFYYKGNAQGIFRSEYKEMLEGTLLFFEFKNKLHVLNTVGLGYVFTQFTSYPELDKLNVPESMLLVWKEGDFKPMSLKEYVQAVSQEIHEAHTTPSMFEAEGGETQVDTETMEMFEQQIIPQDNRLGYIDQEKFDSIVERRIEVIRKSLISKGKEYANKAITQDRMYNFKRGAEIAGKTPTRVLLGYWLKHITSTIDLFDQIDAGIIPSEALVEEKLMDMINYAILADVAITDLRENG